MRRGHLLRTEPAFFPALVLLATSAAGACALDEEPGFPVHRAAEFGDAAEIGEVDDEMASDTADLTSPPGGPRAPGSGGGRPGKGGRPGSGTGTPIAPACVVQPMHEESIKFPGPDFDLEGTITIPAGDSCTRRPAVVLIHGSGAIDRDSWLTNSFDGFSVATPVFADIAQALGAAGYVVVRFDKRTCNAQAGCNNNYPVVPWSTSMYDFYADANAALSWVASRSDVDANRLVVVGHSQGAQLVPPLVSARADVVAGVMLAGGIWQLDESTLYQASKQEKALLDLGYDQAYVDNYLADWYQGAQDFAALHAGAFKGKWIWNTPTSFWLSWMDYIDDAPVLGVAVDEPLLAVSGTWDWNVSPEETQEWADLFAAIPAEQNPGHQALVMPCLLHSLNCVSEAPEVSFPEVDPQDVAQHVDPALLAEVVDFLAGV